MSKVRRKRSNEKTPLVVNWNRIQTVPFELKFPQHTIPAGSKSWKIRDRVVDHPRLLLFSLENKSWKTFMLERYCLITFCFVLFIPIIGFIVSLIFLLSLLWRVRFESWKWCVIIVNPQNPSKWHGWIRLQEHGQFLNLPIIIEILKADQKTFFNYRNITSLFDMDVRTLREEYRRSKGDVSQLVKRLGSILQFDGTFDFDQMIEEASSLINSPNYKTETNVDTVISIEEDGNSIQTPTFQKLNYNKGRAPSIKSSNFSGESVNLKEKYVGIVRAELEEREKLIGIAEESEKKLADLRERINKLKSENRKLKLENTKMKIVVEEKDDEINELKKTQTV